MSPISKEQWTKVLKAALYSFASAFLVALGASGEFSKAALFSAAVAGVNAAFVAVKQLFTEAEPQG